MTEPQNEPQEPNNKPDESPDDAEPQSVSVKRVMQLLRNGEICKGYGRVRWSSNYTMVVLIKDDTLETLAVYKPQAGERPLWDFPTGTLCLRETAAFVVSEALGWGVVPPTVLREECPDGLGSLQFFVEHDPEINYFSLDDSFVPQLKRLAFFDCIINNADRKGGHCLVDAQGKLWGIDHGICFHAYPKLRSVIWDFAGDPLPKALVKDVEDFLTALQNADSTTRQALDPLLSRSELAALTKRSRRLLETGRFPHPGPGPNYPWPPV